MNLIPQQTVAVVICGEDLVCVAVRAWRLGGQALSAQTVRRFLSQSPEARRNALTPLPRQGRVVLVCPSGWAGVRPISLDIEQWRRAKDEVTRSIEQLLPLKSDDAMVGLVECVARAPGTAGDSDGEEGRRESYLVGVRASQVLPWIEAVEDAIGRRVEEVITPHMLLAGLGLQHQEWATIVERSTVMGNVRHVLRFGRLYALEEPDVPDGTPGDVADFRLPDLADGSILDNEASTEEIGIAAAVAPIVSPGGVAPLRGRSVAAPRRWLAPAIAAVIAILIFFGAEELRDMRYKHAAEVALQGQSAVATDVDEILTAKRRLAKLHALLGDEVQARTADWQSVMPLLVAARDTVPESGFLYEMQLNDRQVTIVGEAPRSSVVLANLEARPEFESARNVHPASAVEEREGMETFNIRAQRKSASSAGDGGS